MNTLGKETDRLYSTITTLGACRGSQVDFYSDDPVQIAAAKDICSACLVRAECLDYAKRAGEPGGVWGGLDELQRRGRRLRGRGCPSCDGVLVPVDLTHDRCVSCGARWFA